MILLFAILIITIIAGAICLLVQLVDYSIYETKNKPKIKFDAFKKFYSINPDRWNLDTVSVVCKIKNEECNFYRGLFYTYDSERFYFSFFDWLRYKRFRKTLEKNKLEKKHMESTARMINMVKKDIANMEDLAHQQQKQAMDNLNSILNNLGGTK